MRRSPIHYNLFSVHIVTSFSTTVLAVLDAIFVICLLLLKSSFLFIISFMRWSAGETPSPETPKLLPPTFFCCVDNHKRIDVLFRTAGGFAQSLEKYGQVTIDSLEINSAAFRICSYSRSIPTWKRA